MQAIQPDLDVVVQVLQDLQNVDVLSRPNLIPVCATIPADVLTPTLAYLKISSR